MSPIRIYVHRPQPGPAGHGPVAREPGLLTKLAILVVAAVVIVVALVILLPLVLLALAAAAVTVAVTRTRSAISRLRAKRPSRQSTQRASYQALTDPARSDPQHE